MMHTSIREIELLGIRTVYTDHSIMNTRTISGIAMNKVFRGYSCNMHAFVCVSKANAANFLQRQNAESISTLHIIPNGVRREDFIGDFSSHPLYQAINKQFNHYTIIIGIVSRLVIRKGTNLMIEIIDFIVQNYPNVNFVIAGEGKESYRFNSCLPKWNRDGIRVFLVGEVSHSDIPAFLVIVW